MKTLLFVCLSVGVVYCSPAKHGLLSDFLEPLKEELHQTEQELKPYLLDFLDNTLDKGLAELSHSALKNELTSLFLHHLNNKRNAIDSLLAPIKDGIKQTQEQLKPYLHTVGHTLVDQAKAAGAAALTKGLSDVILNLFSHLFHRNRRNVIDSLLAPLKDGIKQTQEQLKPYLHTVGHTLLDQAKAAGATALTKGISDVLQNLFNHLFHINRRGEPLEAIQQGFEKTAQELKPYLKEVEQKLLSQSEKELVQGFQQSLSDLVSEALKNIVHNNNLDVDVEEIKEFAAKFSSLVHKRVTQLSEFLDQVMNEFLKISSKLSTSIVNPEKIVHEIDAIVAQHRITADIILKYLVRDFKDLLSTGSAPAIFDDVIQKAQTLFQSMFSHLKQMAVQEGESLKKAALELVQQV